MDSHAGGRSLWISRKIDFVGNDIAERTVYFSSLLFVWKFFEKFRTFKKILTNFTDILIILQIWLKKSRDPEKIILRRHWKIKQMGARNFGKFEYFRKKLIKHLVELDQLFPIIGVRDHKTACGPTQSSKITLEVFRAYRSRDALLTSLKIWMQ